MFPCEKKPDRLADADRQGLSVGRGGRKRALNAWGARARWLGYWSAPNSLNHFVQSY
jgi:hypothetical protein